MQFLTLAAARADLWNQASSQPYNEANTTEVANVNKFINRASAAFFFSGGNWRGTLERVAITAYDGFVTLPRGLQTILGVKNSGSRLAVRPIWYEFIGGSCSLEGTSGLNDLGEGFATFRDLDDSPISIRVKPEVVEDAGSLLFRGVTAAGAAIWTDLAGTMYNGVTLALAGGANVTTAAIFGAMPTMISKPVTKGRLSLYSVDAAAVETLIAIMEPGETNANYRRYRAGTSVATVDAICKRAYVPALADADFIVPNNPEALRTMMMALTFKDRSDDERFQIFRDNAIQMADADRQQFDGDNQTPIYNVLRGYGAADIPQLTGWGGGYGPGWSRY